MRWQGRKVVSEGGVALNSYLMTFTEYFKCTEYSQNFFNYSMILLTRRGGFPFYRKVDNTG